MTVQNKKGSSEAAIFLKKILNDLDDRPPELDLQISLMFLKVLEATLWSEF